MSCKNTNSKWWYRLALLGLLLGGCATPHLPAPTTTESRNIPESFLLHGRIGVRHDGQGFSGILDWRHTAQGDEIQLMSPLGQTVARIQRSAENVTLDTSEAHYAAGNVAELTEQVLGWRLPLDGMQYWVLGRPLPDEKAGKEYGDDMHLTRLRQQNWDIQYLDYRMEGNFVLPSRIVLQKETLEIKLIVDTWDLP